MFFEIISETLLPILPMFALKVALSTAFQPAKTVWQNKFLFSRYRASQNLGMPGHAWAKNENFFSKFPNDSIRKVNHLKSIFEHFLKILLTELLGLSHFSAKNGVKMKSVKFDLVNCTTSYGHETFRKLSNQCRMVLNTAKKSLSLTFTTS